MADAINSLAFSVLSVIIFSFRPPDRGKAQQQSGCSPVVVISCFVIIISISCLPLFPCVELDLVRPRRTGARFEQRLEAQQKPRPFGAAVMHELHRLLPAVVPEQDD